MNELVFKKKDDVYTDSLMVAETFGKRHDNVIREIEKLLEGIAKNEETHIKSAKQGWHLLKI